MIQENKWSGIIKDNYCAIADSIMTLHCWYVEGRCALSLTPGMMGRGPGAPLGPVCSVTNDNLSLLPLPHNLIVTLLRGAPNAGHDLSTSHLTKTVTGPWDLPTLSTLSAALNEVSVFILFSVHGVL